MKVFLSEYGLSLFTMIVCIFLTVTASPVSTQIQGAMTDVVNQATSVADFDDLVIVDDGSPKPVGTYNGKKISDTVLTCSRTASNNDLTDKKDLFTVTATYSDGTSENIPSEKIISINKITEDETGITYTATVKGDKKKFTTKETVIAKGNPEDMYVAFDYNDMIMYISNCKDDLKDANVSTVYAKNYGDWKFSGEHSVDWWNQRSTIKSVKILSDIKPTNTDYWFYGFTSAQSIEGLEHLDMSRCMSSTYMFYKLAKNVSGGIPITFGSKFDTSKDKDMSFMFAFCNASSLELGDKFSTTSATTLQEMFESFGNSSTSKLVLNGFSNINVSNAKRMFYYCNVNIIEFSYFYGHSSMDASGMFESSSIKYIDLGNFNPSNVNNHQYMFGNMSSNATVKVKNSTIRQYILKGMTDNDRPSSWSYPTNVREY